MTVRNAGRKIKRLGRENTLHFRALARAGEAAGRRCSSRRAGLLQMARRRGWQGCEGAGTGSLELSSLSPGWWLTLGPGRAGMFCAVVGLWALGQATCTLSGRAARALGVGGILVAASQVFPLAQVTAGVAAMRVWARVGG